MKRGTFIVFEGLDGCGKSTQLSRLARRLRDFGHPVRETGEPYECPAGRRIRAMAGSGEAVAPEQELAWFLEQRGEHVREVVAPALRAGQVVLCDRYYLSTVAYQGARGLDAEAILAESEARFPLPDLVILMQLSAHQGLARVRARGGPAEPVFEREDFLERVAVGFDQLDRPYLERVDARGTLERVSARIEKVVHDRTGLL